MTNTVNYQKQFEGEEHLYFLVYIIKDFQTEKYNVVYKENGQVIENIITSSDGFTIALQMIYKIIDHLRKTDIFEIKNVLETNRDALMENLSYQVSFKNLKQVLMY